MSYVSIFQNNVAQISSEIIMHFLLIICNYDNDDTFLMHYIFRLKRL